MTKVGLDALGTSTTLESNKSHFQMPPDGVVQSQAMALSGLLFSPIRRTTSSTHRVDEGHRALRRSHDLRGMDGPLHAMASVIVRETPGP